MIEAFIKESGTGIDISDNAMAFVQLATVGDNIRSPVEHEIYYIVDGIAHGWSDSGQSEITISVHSA